MPEPLARGGGGFLLRVKGDSMIEARDPRRRHRRRAARSRRAENGDIVVALAGDDETAEEATVKRFFRENGRVRLQPENAALEPIYAAHVQILGKVIGGLPGDRYDRDAADPHARPGAARAPARREPGVPRLRRVRPAPPRA